MAHGGPPGGGGQGRPSRRRGAGRPAGGHGLPARVDRRAPGRAGRAGRHRRRLPLHGRRAGPHRPVGRRGGPADPVRRGRPALDRRPGDGRAVRLPGAGDRRDHAEAGRPTGGLGTVGPPPVGPAGRRATSSTAWSRGSRGWPTPRSWSPTCWATTPWWCWSSPAGCGTGPASCWTRSRPWPTPWPPPGASTRATGTPRLHVPFDRLLTDTSAGVVSLVPTAEGPDIPLVESRGWEPILGDGAKLAGQVADPGRRRATRWCCARRPPAAPSGCPASWPRRGSPSPSPPGPPDPSERRPGHTGGPHRGGHRRPRLRAARGQGGRADRVRRHRPPPAPPPGPHPGPAGGRLLRRPGSGELRGPPPARGGQVRGHGHPHHGGRHPRLPAARVPGRRQALPAHRPDRAAHPLRRRRLAHGVSRLGGSEWQKARSKARAAVHEIAEELVALYRRRLAGHRARLRARHPVAGRAGVVVPLRRDHRPAPGHRGREGGHGAAPAHGPAGLRRRGLRQDRGGHPGRVQGRPGRLPGRRAGAHHPAGQPARPDLRRPVRPLPHQGRAAQPVPDQRPGQGGPGRPGRRLGGRGGRDPPAAGRGRHLQEAGPAGGGRGAALRGQSTRSRSRPWPTGSTCSP